MTHPPSPPVPVPNRLLLPCRVQPRKRRVALLPRQNNSSSRCHPVRWICIPINRERVCNAADKDFLLETVVRCVVRNDAEIARRTSHGIKRRCRKPDPRCCCSRYDAQDLEESRRFRGRRCRQRANLDARPVLALVVSDLTDELRQAIDRQAGRESNSHDFCGFRSAIVRRNKTERHQSSSSGFLLPPLRTWRIAFCFFNKFFVSHSERLQLRESASSRRALLAHPALETGGA